MRSMILTSSIRRKNRIDRSDLRPVFPVLRPISWPICGGILLFCLSACVHNIHVTPAPEPTTSPPFPVSVKIEVPFLALEGADHMPGITLLKWPPEDLRDAIVGYIQKRGSFAAVSSETGDFIDFTLSGRPIFRESYVATGTAVGPVAVFGARVPMGSFSSATAVSQCAA